MNNQLVKFNANPWGKKINDCAIRAIVLGLGFGYKAACKELHVACKNGYGLVRDTGIDLDYIKRTFNEFFGEVVDFGGEDMEDVPEEFKDLDLEDIKLGIDPTASGLTLSEFLDMHKDSGSFLVNLVEQKTGDGHIVFANCSPGKNFIVDIFDSTSLTVNAWMQIVKTLPKSDPRHFKLDPITKKFIA